MEGKEGGCAAELTAHLASAVVGCGSRFAYESDQRALLPSHRLVGGDGSFFLPGRPFSAGIEDT